MNTQLAETFTKILDELEAMLNEIAEFSPGQSIADVKAEYQDTLYQAMEEYLRSSRSVVIDRNKFNRCISDGFTMAFYAGWADAGASGPITDEAQAWLNGRIEQEKAFVAPLFSDLKALREDETLSIEAKLQRAQYHAENYTNTVTGVYAQAEMMAQPERDGRWELGATEEHCDTCAGLNGKTHPLSWYIDNGYIPQEAGSQTLTCGGWHCDCRIVDPKTGDQLIP